MHFTSKKNVAVLHCSVLFFVLFFTVIFVYSIFIFLTLSQYKLDIVDLLFYSVFWSLFSPMSCCIGLAICILFEFKIFVLF